MRYLDDMTFKPGKVCRPPEFAYNESVYLYLMVRAYMYVGVIDLFLLSRGAGRHFKGTHMPTKLQ